MDEKRKKWMGGRQESLEPEDQVWKEGYEFIVGCVGNGHTCIWMCVTLS